MMLELYENIPRKIINYQIYLITICTNLFIISTVSTYQFVCDVFESMRRKLCESCGFVLSRLKQEDLNVALVNDHYPDRSNSVFFSNKHNDHQTRVVLQKMDIMMKWVSFWPKSVKLVIKHVEMRLYLEAEYCSKVLNHCQQTRAQLNEDETNGTFFNYIPIFMSIINREFELTNEIIQNCESLLNDGFIRPLELSIQDFNLNLGILKQKWNERVNQMQDLTIELRKSQKIYLKCALHYVRLTLADAQNNELIKDEAYQTRETVYKGLLVKAESEYKSKINELNKCMTKLERFKNHCLNEVQTLIDDTSRNVRKLTLNYVTKLYPNQKNQLLNQLITIVPEHDFRTFVNNLEIPNLPTHSFTRYDKITC